MENFNFFPKFIFGVISNVGPLAEDLLELVVV
jgi:hypothetical protein